MHRQGQTSEQAQRNTTTMATQCSTFPCSFFFPAVAVLVLFLSEVWCSLAVTQYSPVKLLPGFEGPLPFHLETGYVGVGGESEEVQLFYYFVESEKNPKEDPLMLWLTGGHGCSALSGLLFEIGPLNIKVEEYNGSLPSLVLNPYSWTKVASVIFVDLPANTGFSYTKSPDPEATQRSDSKQILHGLQFLRKWLIDHPKFLSSSFYVAGDSYSGIIVPAVALEILKGMQGAEYKNNGNEVGLEPSINFQGYLLGNPLTKESIDFNSRIPYAHGMGLLSDELYESLKSACGGVYYNVEPSNKICTRIVENYNSCVSGVCEPHILERKCVFLSPKPVGEQVGRRSLDEKSETELPTLGCRTYTYLLAHYWANNDKVREALGIRKGSIGRWKRCSKTPYTKEIDSSIPFHVNLSTKGYRALVYSGDHDLVIPFRGTQEWIRSLNYSIVDDWRQWLVQGQVAGFQRTYSNGMTFATVKGGGHTAPEYKPKECFAMFERWISKKPL